MGHIIIYKNTEDINILFVLSKKDIDNLAPYILVEEAFEIIDILIDASSHYSLSLDANTYFELAMLKICNKVKGENKISVYACPIQFSMSYGLFIKPGYILKQPGQF